MQRFHLFLLAIFCLTTSLARAADSPPPSDADLQFFESKVRPVLVERCFKCHSNQEGKSKGGLFLDSRAAILKGGDNGPAIALGDPGQSRLITAIGYKDVDLQMPPKGKLTDAQVAELTEWVKKGAPWPAEKGPVVAAGGGFNLAKRKAEHWAWQPVKAVEPPAVKNAAWAKTDIDHFILAKLEEKSLTPQAPADKRTLIRRATLTLTGLPPTTAEVDAFLADQSPDAFAKVVDRLLDSPHFGEEWARHWLDLVRYAETRGHEFDYGIPNAYQYRDYVIRAFNADVPYDQFVTEHIAGDLMPKPRMDKSGTVNESVIATGFWFMNEWIHSPVDIRADETDRVDNQIDVFGKTFLAMTIGCARCHDHKFDAISTKDYYALAGFMHSSSYRDVHFAYERQNHDLLAKVKAVDEVARRSILTTLAESQKPVVERFSQYLLAAAVEARGHHDGSGAAVDGPTARDLDPVLVAGFAQELKAALQDPVSPLHPFAACAMDGASAPTAARLLEILKSLAAKPAAWEGGPGSRLIVDYGAPGSHDWMTDGVAYGDAPAAAGFAMLGATADRPITSVFRRGAADSGLIDAAAPGMLRTPTIAIDKPWLTFRVLGSGSAFVVIDSHRMVEGPLHGIERQQFRAGDAWRIHAVNLKDYIGQRAHVEFTGGKPDGHAGVQWVRLGNDPPPAEAATRDNSSAEMAAALLGSGAAPDNLTELAQRSQKLIADASDRLVAGQLGRAPGDGLLAAIADWMSARPDRFGYGVAAHEKVAALLAERAAQRKTLLADLRGSPTAMAMLDGSPVDEHVLIRGSHKTPGEAIPRRFLEAIDGPAPLESAGGSGRLELAAEINDPANPLTSRVIVNRVWHHLFGRGIVASTDNFGVLGERPTHPQLLDFLASGFTADHESIKRLIRRLMLTQTWQMSSHETDESAAQVDPQNLLLHRANLRRLEGESIRDQMLSVSGRLNETMFGPSIEVYLTAFMDGRGRPGSGPLDGNGRRSIYTKVRRNFLPPMMLAFDMPQPFNSMGRRTVSNVPAQALILMNDPFVIEQAGFWAKRVLADGNLKSAQERVAHMYEMAYARPPTQAELAAAVGFLDRHGEELGVEAGKRQTDQRVWADLAHVLMNVKEFIYVP